MQQDKRHVPDWLLERLALGELDAETAADVRRRLAAEGRSPDDIAAVVAASNREILEQLPPTPTAASIRRRAAQAESAPRRRTFLWLAPLVLAGGAAAAMFPLLGQTERIKGPAPSNAPRLYVYRHGTDGNQRLNDGARAARGDLVQLAYRSRGGYGVLFSIDGAGKVTLHWPERNDGPAATLQALDEFRLPSSYELDDAPAFERFFLVRAAAPFSVATALEAARALAAQPSVRKQLLALPPGFEQISLALEKTPAGTKELP